MKAIKQFQGVPDGGIYPVTYEPGDDVPPELHATARHFSGQGPEGAPAAKQPEPPDTKPPKAKA